MPKLIDIRGITFAYAKNKLVCLEPICLDIETANNHAEKVEDLITWISSIQIYFNGCYFLLRKPEELMKFYKYLYDELELIQEPPHVERRLYTFIHNASFDLSYLIPYFREYLPYVDGEPQGIIEGNNKILMYSQGCLEFRCTYRLTGKSLAKWTNELQVEHAKKVGLYDYEAIIYQDSILTSNMEEYDKNDVVGLYEALMKHNELHGDDLTKMPMTLTGYVRRDLRRACMRNHYFRQKYFLKNQLDDELYYACLKSFAGGFTHNNRFYKNITVRVGETYQYFNERIKVKAIGHADFKSHYPSQMTCYPFPVGRPQLIYENTDRRTMTIEDIIALYPKYYTMSVVMFYRAEINDKRVSMPFMQYSKCHDAGQTKFDNVLQDNGRIICAKGKWIMYLDNLTLQILKEQYDLEYQIIKVWQFKAEKLPDEIIQTVDKYFKGKTDKKALVKELEEKYGKTDSRTFEASFDLMTLKVLLNSLYGCCATNPLRTTYKITDNMEFRIDKIHGTQEEIKEGLNEFYSKRNNFLAYQFAWAVTSLSRFELYKFIRAIGYNKVLYCDTDSAFYIKDTKTEKAIKRLNDEHRKTAHFVILESGKKEYYDSFEPEPDCLAFRGLHSKCYGVVTEHGLELTIAGVPARTLIGMDENNEPIYLTREQELQGDEKDPIKALDKLQDEFTFTVNTGLSACYIGAVGGLDGIRKPTILNVNGHEISTAGGCVIKKLKEKKVHDLEYDYTYEFPDIPNEW